MHILSMGTTFVYISPLAYIHAHTNSNTHRLTYILYMVPHVVKQHYDGTHTVHMHSI